jgi:hypothetical protein
MRRNNFHRVSIACAVFGLCSSAAAAAEIMACNGGLAGASARSLFLSSRTGYVPYNQTPATRASQLSLVYVTPSTSYTSGVVIIKLRHVVASVQSLSNPNIRLHRDSYRSPCSRKRGQPAVSEFGDGSDLPRYSDTQQYIAYHRYGRPNSNIDRLHADIGNRPDRDWTDILSLNNRCASTSDWDIAPQFLFDENPTDRMPLPRSVLPGSHVSATYEATSLSAFAAPTAYSSYQGLEVQVVPYRRDANKSVCIRFPVDRIPGNASRTDVMILDADDARYPTQLLEPQTTWSINWQ